MYILSNHLKYWKYNEILITFFLSKQEAILITLSSLRAKIEESQSVEKTPGSPIPTTPVISKPVISQSSPSTSPSTIIIDEEISN